MQVPNDLCRPIAAICKIRFNHYNTYLCTATSGAVEAISENKRDWLDIFEIFGKVLLTPATVLIAGYFINNSFKEKDRNMSYVALAVGVLQEEPSDETEDLRIWATDIVTKFSPITFSEAARKELKTTPLPRISGSRIAPSRQQKSAGFNAGAP